MLFTVSTAVEVRTALLASICRTRALSTTRLAHSNAALSFLLATRVLDNKGAGPGAGDTSFVYTTLF